MGSQVSALPCFLFQEKEMDPGIQRLVSTGWEGNEKGGCTDKKGVLTEKEIKS